MYAIGLAAGGFILALLVLADQTDRAVRRRKEQRRG